MGYGSDVAITSCTGPSGSRGKGRDCAKLTFSFWWHSGEFWGLDFINLSGFVLWRLDPEPLSGKTWNAQYVCAAADGEMQSVMKAIVATSYETAMKAVAKLAPAKDVRRLC